MPYCLFRSILTCCHRVKSGHRRSEYESGREEIPRRETPIPDDPTPTSSLKFSIKPPSTLSDEAADRSWADFDGVHFIDQENKSSSPTTLPPIETSTPAAESTLGVEGGAGEENALSSGGPHHHVDEQNDVVSTSKGTEELISLPEMCPPVIPLSKHSINSATTTDQPRFSPLSPSHRNRVDETCSEKDQHGSQEVVTNPEVLNDQSLPFQESPLRSPSHLRENDESRAGHTPIRPCLAVQGEADTQSGVDTPFQETPYFTIPDNDPELKGPLGLINEPENDNGFLHELNQRLLNEAREIVHAPSEASVSDNQDEDRGEISTREEESTSEISETSDPIPINEVVAALEGVLKNPSYWENERVLKTPYSEDGKADPTEDSDDEGSDQSSICTADVQNIENASAAFFAFQTQWKGHDVLAHHPHDSVFHSPDIWTPTGSVLCGNEFYHHSQDGKSSLLEIDPIPFNPLYERTSTRTPSIHSLDSELDCESPLFEKSYKAMGREKYLEGPDCLPKQVVAAGLIRISRGELSLEAPQNKRRSLSVFRDQSPGPTTLPPKPLTRGPLQDVTSHYYSEANAQRLPDSEKGKERSTDDAPDSSGDEEGLIRFETATLVPVTGGHSMISLEDTTIDLGSSLIIPSSSPFTSPEPPRTQSIEDLRSSFISSPIPFRAQAKCAPPLSGKPRGAGVASALKAAGAPKVRTTVRSPASLLSREELRQMVLEDVEDWRRRHQA
jgi:hypothetical protein